MTKDQKIVSAKVEIEKLIHAAVLTPLDHPNDNFCRWGLPLLLWGMPGIGKSERIVIGALKAGLTTKQVYAPRFIPDDVSGVNVPDGMGDVKTVCSIAAVKELENAGEGVFFIDELSSCKDAMQAAFLGVVLDRDIAGHRIRGQIRIMAAANPPEVAANGRELTSALSNRLCHIQVPPPTALEWSEWMLKGNTARVMDVEQGEAIIKEKWDYEWARASALFARGIRANPTLLYQLPSDESGSRGLAWPSPRTWEFAARAYTACKCLGYDRDVSDVLIEGCVGHAAAGSILEWISSQDLPEPEEVLKNGFKADMSRMDRAFLIYNSVTHFVASKKDRKEKIELGVKLWEIFKTAKEDGLMDLVLDFVKVAINNQLGMGSDPRIKAIAKPIIDHIGDDPFIVKMMEQEQATPSGTAGTFA